MRITPFIVLFMLGVLLGAFQANWESGNIAVIVADVVGQGTGLSLLGGTIYCFATRKKIKKEDASE